MCQPHKMVKHAQVIRRKQSTNCLSVSEYFVGTEMVNIQIQVIRHNFKNQISFQ